MVAGIRHEAMNSFDWDKGSRSLAETSSSPNRNRVKSLANPQVLNLDTLIPPVKQRTINKVDKDALKLYIDRAFKGKCRCWGSQTVRARGNRFQFSMNSECGMFYLRKVFGD